MPPVIIVGASLGGLRAAEALRRNGYPGEITIIGDEPYMPYNRPPLSKDLLSEGKGFEDVAYPIKDSLVDVEWILGDRVVALDSTSCEVTLASGKVLGFSKAILATGLSAKPLPIPSHGLTGVFTLRNLDDALELGSALQPGKKVVILGSGFIGCEVAATASKRGCEVWVASSSRIPLHRALGSDLGLQIQRIHEANGVKFQFGASIFGLIGETKVEQVILDSGVILDCDVLVVAIGSNPNVDFLVDSNLDTSDGILVNNFMQAITTSGDVLEHIYAVGDVARYTNPLFDDTPRRVEHWNLPTETAKRAAESICIDLGILDLVQSTFAPLPSFWSDQYDTHLLAFGMPYIADSNKLIAGEITGECIFEYYRQGKLVGVCGIGMRAAVQKYRNQFQLEI